jgi:hypothetical protein
LVQDGRRRVIRITTRGHTFVIEQVPTAEGKGPPEGNVYQSNVAVVNNVGHLGIAIEKYLRENPNPVDLDAYLGDLADLTSGGKPVWTRLSLYKKLFTTKSYRNNPEVRRITSEEFEASADGLNIQSITWQFFNESDVLQNVLKILNAPEYHNTVAAFRAKRLFFAG